MPTPADQLASLRSEGLLRQLRALESPAGPNVVREGKHLWNFSSNDYLGLACHPAVAEALAEGARRFGAGAAASRLVCGTLPPHVALEDAIAAAKQSGAALVFSSGFATAMGAVPAIAGKADFVLLDKLCHACLVDASRLSGATLRVFPHNDTVKLERLLSSIRAKAPHARILILTESVFSMDGDICPLREIVELAETHDAMVLLDEAHGFGVLGATGMGLAELEGLQHRVTFQMGTLSKAAGLSGGYLATSRQWVDLLVNRARSFIYSTAPPPALAHAAMRSLEIIRSPEGHSLRRRLRENIKRLGEFPSPVIPVVFGGNDAALAASSRLAESGFLVPAIRYPTVPRGTARLRVSLSAAHPPDAVHALRKSLDSIRSSSP